MSGSDHAGFAYYAGIPSTFHGFRLGYKIVVFDLIGYFIAALIGRNIQKSKVDILPTILDLKRFICMKI